MANHSDPERHAVVGNPSSPSGFWLYSSHSGYDLTHPPSPSTPAPGPFLRFATATDPIKVRPSITALVVIDMQNFFLSPSLGRSPDSSGLAAQQQLLEHAIPATRRAGIRVVWLNWGLTESEVDHMPPAMHKAFGFATQPVPGTAGPTVTSEQKAGIGEGKAQVHASGKPSTVYKGLGSDMGLVTLPDGREVPAGRLLMRDQWNADLTPELRACYEEGLTCDPPDVWIHKNRMSGLWGANTLCTDYLDREGIRTLLFAGVNTDQCVGGSFQDAFSKGYDCIMLTDCCATTSPRGAHECMVYNAQKTWGFGLTAKMFAEGVAIQE